MRGRNYELHIFSYCATQTVEIKEKIKKFRRKNAHRRKVESTMHENCKKNAGRVCEIRGIQTSEVGLIRKCCNRYERPRRKVERRVKVENN